MLPPASQQPPGGMTSPYSSTPPAGSPAPGPGGYPGNPAGGGATYPGNSNGAIPYPSNGGAAPYPNGGGASINSPGRWPNAWTSRDLQRAGRRRQDSRLQPVVGNGASHRLRRRSIAQASCRPRRIIALYPFALHLRGAVGVGSIFDMIQGHFPAVATGANRWRLARWAALVAKVSALEPELLTLADEQLRKRSLSLRYRAKSGEPLSRLLVEAYALVREAGRRTINMRHFDVQILGGIAMFHRSIVEMQTGEGKTLAATLPHVSVRA